MHPFDSVLGEIGRLQEELWNSHIKPERLELSSDAYDRLMRELGKSGSADVGPGGASVSCDGSMTIRGLEVGQTPLTRREIRLEGIPFRR